MAESEQAGTTVGTCSERNAMLPAVIPSRLTPHALDRIMRYSFAQALLGAIFTVTTTGMFLVGYANALGAGNFWVGVLSSVPMYCVVAQLLSSALIERGASRKLLSIVGSLVAIGGFALIPLAPYLLAHAALAQRMLFIAMVLVITTLFGNIAGNARGSWIGSLIPARRLGAFFGSAAMFAGLVNTIFSVIGGKFLDAMRGLGLAAFHWLFFAGIAFGLFSVVLYLPQPDVPVTRTDSGGDFWPLVRQTFANRQFMILMLAMLLWTLQMIAAPFPALYLLRDLRISYLALGAITSVAMVAMMVTAAPWGRLVDRYGCRPILLCCIAAVIPAPLIWLRVTTPQSAYVLLSLVNIYSGIMTSGISVATQKLVYQLTPETGRSVQFAIYSVIITLVAAPLPMLGGLVPDWLRALGLHADLRAPMLLCIPCIAASALAARMLREPSATGARAMLRRLFTRLWRVLSLSFTTL